MVLINCEKNFFEDVETINEKILNERNIVSNNFNQNISLYNPVQIENIISNNLCDYIVQECEVYAKMNQTSKNPTGWTTTRHKKYPTTDLPVPKIPMLKTLIYNLIHKDIFPLFEKYFSINQLYLDMNDVFVVKYEAENQNYLQKHKDGTAFSFNILLNSSSDFEGGGTKFYYTFPEKKEEIIKNEKGGLLIHTGFIHHEGVKITSGKRYLLVGFISYLKFEHFFLSSLKKNNNVISVLNSNNNNNNINNNNNNINNINNNVQEKTLFLDFKKANTCLLRNFNLPYFTENNDFKQNLLVFMEKFPLHTFLLNKQKNTINILEKVVYDLSLYHIEKDNKNIDDFEIEFWIKNEKIIQKQLLHNPHSDKDEKYRKLKNEFIHPYLSSVTYLHTTNSITLISNMEEEDSSKGNLVLNNGLNVSYCNENKHIIFYGGCIHNVLNMDIQDNDNKNRYAIMFNLWYKHKPLQIDYYENKNYEDSHMYNKNTLIFPLEFPSLKQNISTYEMYKLVKYFYQKKIDKLVIKLKKNMEILLQKEGKKNMNELNSIELSCL